MKTDNPAVMADSMAHARYKLGRHDLEKGALVSIGIPVRNGGQHLEEAMECLVKQTYRNLEIIISDNCSEDNTQAICRKYMSGDQRIRLYTQTRPLDVLDNFKYVLDRAKGDYFLWAAADDRRSLNFVEALLETLMRRPEASLAFCKTAKFNEHEVWSQVPSEQYDFELSANSGYWRRIWNREFIRSGYLHTYGLMRRQAIASYEWAKIEVGPDRPLLFHLSCRGAFVRADEATFFCYKPMKPKRAAQRAPSYYGRRLGLFPYVRLNWVCAKVGCRAERLEGRRRSLLATFAVFQAVETRRRLRRRLGSMKRALSDSISRWLTRE